MSRILLVLITPLLFVGCMSASKGKRDIAASGTAFYIDANDGNDDNDGKTPVTAWRTLRHVREVKFEPGTSIYLHRGSVWNETLQPKASGTPEKKISFSSYGEGALPKLSGAIDVAQRDWTHVAANIWRTPLPSDQNEEPEKMFIDNTQVPDDKLKQGPTDLRSEGEWAWEPIDGGTLFLFTERNPEESERAIEVNVLRYSADIKGPFVSLSEVEVTRSRDGLRLGGRGCEVNQIVARENTLNGIVVTGSGNRLMNFESTYNGLQTQIGKQGRTGHGVLVSGGDNVIEEFIASDNEEDGIQFSENAAGGNLISNATMKRNGENCIDVKSGDQKITGGDLASDADPSEDCIIVHKIPHHVIIEGTKAMSTTKGPALSVFGGARVTVNGARLKSDLSSAVHIDATAGDQSTVINTRIEGGGLGSKSLVSVNGGKGHLIKGNTLTPARGVEGIKVTAPAEATVEDNQVDKK